MQQMIGAVYDSPKEGLPTLVVVFIPEQDSIICRPAKSRDEAEALLAQLKSEIGSMFDEVGNA
jgi:hypothetical protein